MNAVWLCAMCVGLVTPTTGPSTEERPDLRKYFTDAGFAGCCVVFDLKADRYITVNGDRADRGYVPASTFKIFNSLTSLETGVIADEHTIIKWDGVKREFEAWNRDHDMASAIQVSCLPFYQELARRVGRERMQHYIDAVGYGNRNIGGPIDLFWLEGDLRITARQQVEFLKRLYFGELPYSKRSMEIVKRILINEQTPAYTLRTKTGWCQRPDWQVGWWVGWVERSDGDVFFFATNIESDKREPNFAASRIEITTAILKDLGALPR